MVYISPQNLILIMYQNLFSLKSLNLEIIYSLENLFDFESLFFGDLNFGM